jgi:two-component system, OmpR family, KDP operon response regulator KdpE
MSNPLIVVIDDEPQIRRLLKISLEAQGFRVIEANTGHEGMVMAAQYAPELVLLDLGLPDQNGHEVLVKLREWYSKAIVILSVKDSEDDIVEALENGASDYLTKPFRNKELVARLRAALRRNAPEPVRAVYTFAEFELDITQHRLTCGGEEIKLTQTEFQLLALFAKNEGRVLTHHYILKEIWGVGYQTQTQYLRVFVASLRKKLELSGSRCIQTESGVGYRLVSGSL